MSEGISSEDNLSFVTIYILVNPSAPGGKRFFVGFHHLETWIHIITFLIIVHSVALTRKKTVMRSIREMAEYQHSSVILQTHSDDV